MRPVDDQGVLVGRRGLRRVTEHLQREAKGVGGFGGELVVAFEAPHLLGEDAAAHPVAGLGGVAVLALEDGRDA